MAFVPTPLLGRYLVKLFFGLLVLALVVVTLLFAVMNTRYMRATTEEIVRFSQQAVAEKSRHAEFIMRQVVAFAVDLYADPLVKTYFHGGESDIRERYEIVELLRRRKNSHAFAHSVFLFNADEGLVGPDGSYHTLQIGGLGIQERLERPVAGRFAVHPGEFRRSATAAAEHVITYIYVHVPSDGTPPEGAIVMNVYEEAFAGQLADTGEPGESSFIVADYAGTVLSHTDTSLIGSEVPASWLSNGDSGAFRDSTGERDRLVVHRWSEPLDWWLYSVTPYDSLLVQARAVRRDLLVALAVAIGVCLVLAWVVSRRLYRPVYALVEAVGTSRVSSNYERFRNELQFIRENFAEITEQSEQDQRVLRGEFLRNLMLADLSGEVVERVARRLEPALPRTPIRVVLVSLDSVSDLARDDASVLHFYISRELGAAEADPNCTIVPITGTMNACVVGGSRAASAIERHADDLRRAFRGRFGRTISIAISAPADELAELREAYLAAESLLRHRLLTGPDRVHTSTNASSVGPVRFDYPGEMERSIIEALKRADRDAYESELATFIDYARTYDYRRFSYLVIQAALAILKQMNVSLGEVDSDAFTDFDSLVLRFRQMQDIGEVFVLFSHLYEHYHELRESAEARASGQQRELIASVKWFVRSQLASPLLSVELVASHVNYSAGHLSRLFRAAEGEKLSDYITRLRFDEARGLLARTDDNVNAVARAVGFTNVNYFYTAFKRFVGVTPAVYRTACRRGRRGEQAGA